MIKLITTKQTYPLRSQVLRAQLPIETCYFDHDNDTDSFHLGYFADSKIICIITFVKKEYKNSTNSYQLRGMATHPDYRSQGYGQKLLTDGVSRLKNLKVDTVWCNARVSAINFYKNNGFLIDSQEFIIKTAGAHVKMMKSLK